jgi:hypothetical protein
MCRICTYVIIHILKAFTYFLEQNIWGANMKVSNNTLELYFHWHIINIKFYTSSSHEMNRRWEKLHGEFKEMWQWSLLTWSAMPIWNQYDILETVFVFIIRGYVMSHQHIVFELPLWNLWRVTDGKRANSVKNLRTVVPITIILKENLALFY